MPTKIPPEIRPARATDVPALTALENTVFDTDRISARSFRRFIASGTAEILIAEKDGAIAGYFVLLFRRGTAMARLYSIAVSPAMTGRGIGRLLLEAAEEAAFRHERMLLRLEVREDNHSAISLYRKHGYRPIGKYLDYYEDHADALRFEKTLRGKAPASAMTPYYEQTTDFTCGPACLMMAMARFDGAYKPDPVDEIKLWREATTVFMMSGLGGCGPQGLAVAAKRHGLSAEIHVSDTGDLFLDTVKTAEKRRVMELAQADFHSAVRKLGIRVHARALAPERLSKALANGQIAIVLMSGYTMFGKKVPHWVLVHGDDGRHFFIHDPWVEDEEGETHLDAANLPVPYGQFEKMSRFGKAGLRAAVLIGKAEGN